jgi:transposase
MPAKINPAKVDALALLVARGLSVRAAARRLGVAESTGARWAATPDFDATVKRIRAKAIDRTVSILATASSKAALTLVRQLGKGKPDAIQLQAAKAILAEFLHVTEVSDFAQRLEEIERNSGGYHATKPRKFG